MRGRNRRTVLAGVLALAGSRRALADEHRSTDLRFAGWYLCPGLEVGGSYATSGTSNDVGGVVSIVHVENRARSGWAGVQLDLVRQFHDGPNATAWSLGPEVGLGVFGADLSYLGRAVDGQLDHGLRLRPTLTVGVAALDLRLDAILTGDPEVAIGVDLQFKLPLAVAD